MSTPHLTHATRPVAELLRFSCTVCGGCCEGVRIPLYDADEEERARSAARELGVDVDPVDSGALRLQDGHCVFLGQDNRCRIHGELGMERKPIPCQQFPLIALAAGDEIRVGIDPASYGAMASWKDGEVLADTRAVAASTPAPGGQAELERALVRMCEDPDASLTGLLSVLTREPAPRGQVPSAFAERWAERLHTLDFDAFLALNGPGPALRRNLAPLARASTTWAEGPPPWHPLPEPLDDWAVEVLRRSLWLRLTSAIPNVSVAALFVLGGAVAAAWVDPRPQAWHATFTAWIRALRFEIFWKTLAGDKATLMWLGTGQRP